MDNNTRNVPRIFLWLAFLLQASCGSGSGSDTPARTMDSQLVVTTPENDTNSNGIRDDVELAVNNYATGTSKQTIITDVALKMQSLLNGDDGSTRDEETLLHKFLASVDCLRSTNDYSPDDLLFVKLFTLDTQERQDAYESIYIGNIESVSTTSTAAEGECS